LNIVRQGFTVYDAEQHFAFVQIERGKDDVNMTGIEIGFNFGGTTKTYQSDNVPTPNGKYTYKFNFTNDFDMGIPKNVTPDKVTVAPIFTINNKKRLGKILDSEDMPVGRIHMSAEEWTPRLELIEYRKEGVLKEIFSHIFFYDFEEYSWPAGFFSIEENLEETIELTKI